MKNPNKNMQVINAIICAILMIGFSLILKNPEDINTLFMVLGAIAAIQVVMSLFLINTSSKVKKKA